MIKTRAEAETVVKAARYRPISERSVGGQLHAASFGTDAATYLARANDEILVVLMAEHVDCIRNIERHDDHRYRVVLKDGTEIVASRSGSGQLRSKMRA